MQQPSLTVQEIQSLWEKHKDDPPSTVIEYTTQRGERVEILVGYLRYLNEYVSEVRK